MVWGNFSRGIGKQAMRCACNPMQREGQKVTPRPAIVVLEPPLVDSPCWNSWEARRRFGD